ncbi:MAG: pyrroline-5-carboxylate reductase [Verrucomicrobia bacterium]|nr:pyrroline-5-carboxylate reductase [Verrucomicrobiota bacterium]
MSAGTTIGFLGAGRMATALAKGFVKGGLVQAAGLIASDCAASAREAFRRELGAAVTEHNAEVAAFARVLLLAVKPAQASEVLAEIRPRLTPDHLLISIVAGVPIAALEEAAGGAARVVRVMPNTPALVGAAACAYALGTAATPEDAQRVQALLSGVGLAWKVQETLLDAVTGLSGSGPAYAFLIIEALSDGGVAAGLPRDMATRLAAQTLLGSARMVLETGAHPGALKDMVASPGGTTIDGLHELERAGVRGALMNAVRAATAKAAAMRRH